MNLLTVVAWSALLAPTSVETLFVQVAPKLRPEKEWLRSDTTRAVVLVHGLKVQPFPKADAGRASLREWQQPGSVLVRTLAGTGDVYAFAYGQNVPLDQIAETTSLRAGTRRLREMGYREVVLVGYSAGGIIARQLVEDYPGTGVTKVIQVCAPNAGSGWARVDGIPRGHKPFQRSLTKEERGAALRARLAVTIPDSIEFVCVVGTVALTGDGVVSCRSQWSEDLQAQGVPAVAWAVDHLSVVRSPQHAERLAELVRQPQRRWTQAEVAAGRKTVLGEGLASWRRSGATAP